MKDIAIIGNGPAGLSAAIYGRRAGRSVVVVSDSPGGGGQIATTYEVDNYPGLMGIGGMELGDKFLEHAKSFEPEFVLGRVTAIRDEGSHKSLVLDNDTTIAVRAVIIAAGAEHNELKVPGEKELKGMGVSYCATCDGAFFRNRIVAVVGGGDVALGDALFLSRFASKVILIHRRDEFRGARRLQDKVFEAENIEIMYDTIVTEIRGKDAVEGIIAQNVKTNEEQEVPVNGVFIAVGIHAGLDGIDGLPERDEAGYIIADETCKTSIPGIYAAGDVRTKPLRQVVTAVADGANAITSIEGIL